MSLFPLMMQHEERMDILSRAISNPSNPQSTEQLFLTASSTGSIVNDTALFLLLNSVQSSMPERHRNANASIMASAPSKRSREIECE